MIEPITVLKATLERHQQNITAPRLTVFKALLHGGPLTIAELIRACSPGIDRASVYRTVALFERLNIVKRLQIGWKYRLEVSDDFQHHHHHFHCLGCGKVIAMPEDAALEKRLQLLADEQGFTPEDHQLEIRGLCKNCREKSRSHSTP